MVKPPHLEWMKLLKCMFIKPLSIAKLKKAVKREKSRGLVVDTMDNTIVAKLPANADTSKYDKYKYMFYYIGRKTT